MADFARLGKALRLPGANIPRLPRRLTGPALLHRELFGTTAVGHERHGTILWSPCLKGWCERRRWCFRLLLRLLLGLLFGPVFRLPRLAASELAGLHRQRSSLEPVRGIIECVLFRFRENW